jgi:hypothetical protein
MHAAHALALQQVLHYKAAIRHYKGYTARSSTRLAVCACQEWHLYYTQQAATVLPELQKQVRWQRWGGPIGLRPRDSNLHTLGRNAVNSAAVNRQRNALRLTAAHRLHHAAHARSAKAAARSKAQRLQPHAQHERPRRAGDGNCSSTGLLVSRGCR